MMTEAVTRASQCLTLTKQAQYANSGNKDCVNMYILDRAFQRLLQPFGLSNDPVPFQTIVQYLKEYIVSKGLFDPSHPHIINCQNDDLGILFKRISFTNHEAVDLMRRHISPVFTQRLHDVDLKLIKNVDDRTNVGVLEGVSDNDDEDGSETYSSVEEMPSSEGIDVEFAFSETSLFEEFGNEAISTSILSTGQSAEDDIDSDSSVQSCFTEFNEFEPFSGSDDAGSEDDFESYSSGSDLEIHIVEKEITVRSVSFTDDDDDFFADSSDASSCSNEPDRMVSSGGSPWFCKCVDESQKSGKGFCHSCWSSKFGWSKEEDRRIPPSVQKRKRNQRSSAGLQMKKARLDDDQSDGCHNAQSSESNLGSNVSDTTQTVSLPQESFGACVICDSRPKNTAIVHGRTAHIVACYKCSRKIQEKKLKCPQCRRVVERVVRLYL